MDFTRLIIAGVLGGIAGGVGGAIGQFVARLTKQDVKTFYRTSSGQALIIVPVIAVSALTSSLDWDVKIKDQLEGHPALSRELRTQGQALLASEPALVAKLEGKTQGEANALARELSAKGIKRLPVPELRRLGALRLALAEQSPRFCESLWTGGVDEATMAGALSSLSEAELSEFGRLSTTALRLEVRGEGVARPPVDQARLMALMQALVDVYGDEQGGELKRIFVQGLNAPRADGCRAARMMLGALPKLSDENATTAVMLLPRGLEPTTSGPPARRCSSPRAASRVFVHRLERPAERQLIFSSNAASSVCCAAVRRPSFSPNASERSARPRVIARRPDGVSVSRWRRRSASSISRRKKPAASRCFRCTVTVGLGIQSWDASAAGWGCSSTSASKNSSFVSRPSSAMVGATFVITDITSR